jgi:hypothetical protein
VSPSDRRLIPLPLAMLAGVIAAGIAAQVVRLPGGAYDMSGIWIIAGVGAATTLVGLVVSGAWFWRRG